MSNLIIEKQKEDQYVRKLSAYRQLYSDEKILLFRWIMINIAVAVIGMLISFVTALKDYSSYFTLITVCIVIVELYFLPWIIRHRENAAAIQEFYDQDLFKLKRNDFLVKQPDDTIISGAAERWKEDNSREKWEELREWYTKQAKGWTLHQARIVCHWQNTWWNRELRREFSIVLQLIVGFVVVVLVGLGIWMQWTVEEFVSVPFILFLPLLLLGLNHAAAHRQIVRRLNELRSAINLLWDKASQESVSLEEIDFETRLLQSEIYHIRKDGPPIPDFYYSMRKDSYEKLSQTPGHFTGDDQPPAINSDI